MEEGGIQNYDCLLYTSTRYGMTDEFDMVAMENVTNQYLGGDTSLSCSADTQKEIDEKVVQLAKAEHEKARKILAENRKKLDELAMYCLLYTSRCV